jgi:hypothetical protein
MSLAGTSRTSGSTADSPDRSNLPDAGDPEWFAIAPRNGVPLPAAVFLKNDATPLAVGFPKPLILCDIFGARMDWSEIRTFLAGVRDEAPAQMTLHRLFRLGITPVD